MRNRISTLAVLLAVAALASGDVIACSCAPPGNVEETFGSAKAVFLARVESIDHSAFEADATGRSITETARFVVLEVWKGSLEPGQVVTIRSDIGAGLCGLSAKNKPMGLEEVDPKTHESRPVQVSGSWLIYSFGDEPFELSLCARTRPIELVDEAELKKLRQLVQGN